MGAKCSLETVIAHFMTDNVHYLTGRTSHARSDRNQVSELTKEKQSNWVCGMDDARRGCMICTEINYSEEFSELTFVCSAFEFHGNLNE